MAEQHEGPISYGLEDEDLVDAPPRRIRPGRWTPDDAAAHYRADGAADAENTRYDHAWRAPQPRG